jgi:hypothetical protein
MLKGTLNNTFKFVVARFIALVSRRDKSRNYNEIKRKICTPLMKAWEGYVFFYQDLLSMWYSKEATR